MNITNAQIAKSIEALGELNQMELPFKLSYKLARATVKLESFIKPLDETRQKILIKYAEKDEKGKPVQSVEDNRIYYKTDDSNLTKLSAEMDKLMCIVNTLEEINKITLTEFENIKIKPVHLMALSWLIEKDVNKINS